MTKEFSVGDRVIVRATPDEGADYLWNGRAGKVATVGGAGWATVDFDEPVTGWRNPVLIYTHNLKVEK